MSGLLIGAFLGLMAACGVLLLVANARAQRRIDSRVLPYVQVTGFDWSAKADDASGSSWSRHAARLLNSIVTDASVTRRLQQLNSEQDLNSFRIDQLRWAAAGAGFVIAFGIVRIAGGEPIAPPVWLVLTGVGALTGALLRDRRLTQQARSRSEKIAAELPAFAELLAFTVAAGLAPMSALNRVSGRVGGEFAVELRICCDQVAAGRPFTDALEAMAERTGSDAVARFVDGIVVAVERGTPISEVLRAQAMDARAAGHRDLMESAGRREIYALIPVVFLILPAVVVVAVFPGVFGLVVSTP